MKKISGLLIVIILLASSCGKLSKPKLANDKDSVSYLIGYMWAKSLKEADFADVNPQLIAQAFKDVKKGDSVKMSELEIQQKIQSYFIKLRTATGEKNLKEGQEFLEKNKKAPGIIVRPSGLQYQVIKEGNGPAPDSSDVVKVNYTGTLINGETFDSRNDVEMPVTGGIIAGWTEALTNMKVGSKWKVYIPSNIGFGEQGAGGKIKPNVVTIFEIELLGIQPKTKPEEKPAK